MKNEFVPYDIALAMKELGFDEPCLGMYYNLEDGVKYTEPTWKFIIGKGLNNESEINAPLFQQAFRWFRDKYNIDCRFHTYTHFREGVRTDFMWDYIDGKKTSFDGYKNTLKEAQDACLRKLIEIVKER